MHTTTLKLWAWCAAMASAVIYVGTAAVPVMSMSGCGNNDAIIHCNPQPSDAGAHDGGEGGAGGSEPSDCP